MTSRRVQAVVLTFEARDSLARCLDALVAQERRPDAILVVDNHSSTVVDDLVAAVPGATLLRLDDNLGPAGGYAAGLREFLVGGAEWAWVMDDDCIPRPNALAAQLAVAAPDRLWLSSMVDADTGEAADTHGWCGVLLSREIVTNVGVPREDLFWWSEDTEYLQWRIPVAGYPTTRCEDAIVEVTRGRADAEKPAWKYYYESRNQVFFRLHVQRPEGAIPDMPHLTRRVRGARAARAVGKLVVRAGLRERSGRPQKLLMIVRGTLDGLRGRLGRTVVPDDPNRPLVTPEPGDV